MNRIMIVIISMCICSVSNIISSECKYKIISYENNYITLQNEDAAHYEIINTANNDTIFRTTPTISLFPEEVRKFIFNDTLVSIRFQAVNFGEAGIEVDVSFYDLKQKPVKCLGNIKLEDNMFSRATFIESNYDFTIILSGKISRTDDDWKEREISDKMRCITISIPLQKIIREYYVDSK